MITVVLSWIYIFIICFLLGVGVFSLGTKLCGKKDFTASVSLLTVLGVMVSTVIASYISCVAGIGMPAHLFLVLLAGLSAVWQRRQLVMYWKKIKPVVLSWEGFFYFCFILFIAFFASRGEFHTDTNIYHAQNIRIYEEYGLIKGMGNLQQHFAYNSSYLAFAAVFSMKWLLGQSLHTTTGFLEVLFCIYAFYGLKRWKSHKKHLADCVKLGIPFYVLVILIRSMSPATDFGTMLFVQYLLAAWCDNLEEKKDIFFYSLLSVVAVFVATMKFSACLIVLLAIYPAVCLLRDRQWKTIVFCLLSGILVVCPFLIRNFLISGWLLYPFDKIDLFHVAWKIPQEYLVEDSARIKVWGRCLYDVELLNLSPVQWIPYWWSGQERYEQMLLGSVLAGTLLLGVQAIYGRIRRAQIAWDKVVLAAVIYINIVLWFFMAPFIRYGLAFLFAVPMLALGEWCSAEKKGFYSIVCGGLVFCIVVCLSPYWDRYITDGGVFLKHHLTDPYYIKQQDYDRGNMESMQINGNEIYFDAAYDEINSYFTCPGTCYKSMLERSTLMGDEITDGFMAR